MATAATVSAAGAVPHCIDAPIVTVRTGVPIIEQPEDHIVNEKKHGVITTETEVRLDWKVGFLHLPAEIRNNIYAMTLVVSPAADNTLGPRHRSASTLPCASLLQTCRQVNAEAMHFLYGLNTFQLHPSLLTGLPRLAVGSGATRPVQCARPRSQIKNYRLEVRLDVDARFTPSFAAQHLSNCETLEIEAGEAMYRASGWANLRLLADVRGVKRCRVTGSVDAGVARWLEGEMMKNEGEKGLGWEEWCAAELHRLEKHSLRLVRARRLVGDYCATDAVAFAESLGRFDRGGASEEESSASLLASASAPGLAAFSNGGTTRVGEEYDPWTHGNR